MFTVPTYLCIHSIILAFLGSITPLFVGFTSLSVMPMHHHHPCGRLAKHISRIYNACDAAALAAWRGKQIIIAAPPTFNGVHWNKTHTPATRLVTYLRASLLLYAHNTAHRAEYTLRRTATFMLADQGVEFSAT